MRTHVGHYLLEWRQFWGLSQEEVATAINTEHSSIGRLERGEYGYTQSTLEKLATVYQATPAMLISVNPLLGSPAGATRTQRRSRADASRRPRPGRHAHKNQTSLLTAPCGRRTLSPIAISAREGEPRCQTALRLRKAHVLDLRSS